MKYGSSKHSHKKETFLLMTMVNHYTACAIKHKVKVCKFVIV